MTDEAVPRPMPDPLATVGDALDMAPTADAEALRRARAVFGLDVAPTWAARQEAERLKHLKPGQRRRVKSIVAKMGTPADLVRAMMAKQPPKEWVRALREISPESDATSFLVFAWKEPLLAPDKGRWCLYEAIPDRLIAVERRMELSGPPFWELPKEQRHAQATIVSAYQWEMYHRHRLDVRPFWCLQGSEGGTPLHYATIERRYLRMMGKPDTPAEVGALPLAPWDNRVRDAVLSRDRVVKLGSVGNVRASGTAEEVRAAQQAAEKDYRRAFYDWFAARLAPATELYAHVLKHEAPDRQRQTREDAAAAHEARDHFIEFGRFPDPIQYRSSRLVVAR